MATLALDLACARELDAHDPLARFRDEFVISQEVAASVTEGRPLTTDPDTLYLDGNSLGRLPKRTVARLQNAIEHEWGKRLVRGWGEGWMDAPARIGAKIAQLIGAQRDEVIVADSTSTNFYKLVYAALDARAGRTQIVTETVNFPTDAYILQGIARTRGVEITYVDSTDGITISTDAIVNAIERNKCALVTLTHTAFKSGYVYDMQAVTDAAHRAGALVLWDLSHSVGSLPVDLNACDADLAVGCTYKYLNGGPGAPAFLYVRRDLQEQLLNPIQGWFGQRDQFAMGFEYAPAQGMTRFLVGTPPMLSLLAIEAGVDLLLEAGIENLRAKSVQQTEFLIALWDAWLKPFGVTLNSPRDANMRGSHVSLGHPDGLRIDRALIEEMHVIPDFRPPDNIRFGIAPIYTRFEDIYCAMERMRRVMQEKLYEKYPSERRVVT
ncbi:MAG: kynureninase [Chloroflexi bacterium]|nr:kynureninase [Chloroflexota bacterium]